MKAAESGHAAVVKSLLERDAGQKVMRALESALKRGRTEGVEVMVDVHPVPLDTALELATEWRHGAGVELLITKRAIPSQDTLIRAVMSNNEGMVAFLLGRGVEPALETVAAVRACCSQTMVDLVSADIAGGAEGR